MKREAGKWGKKNEQNTEQSLAFIFLGFWHFNVWRQSFGYDRSPKIDGRFTVFAIFACCAAIHGLYKRYKAGKAGPV